MYLDIQTILLIHNAPLLSYIAPTVETTTRSYPSMSEVTLKMPSETTLKLAQAYAQIVEDYDDPETFKNKGYTPQEWERRRTKAHNEYLDALRQDGIDTSNRAATTGLALRALRCLVNRNGDN